MSMRISYNNLVTASNLTAIAGAADVAPFNLSNLCNGKLQPEARFVPASGATEITLRVDLSSAKRIEVARLCAYDLTEGATIQLIANDTDDSVTGVEGQWSFDLNERYGVVRPGLSEASGGYRYWFIKISGLAANPAEPYRLGELQLCDAAGDIELAVACIESSAQKVMLHKEKVAETEGGQFWSYTNGDIVQFPGLAWQYLNPTQTKIFEDLHKACRGKKNFWLCFDDGTGEVDETYFVTYMNEALSIRPSGPGYNDVEINCQEVAEGVYK